MKRNGIYRCTNQTQSRNFVRAGTSTVEFAVCLPLLLAFLFGSIEVSNAIFVQQALTVSAYEAAKVATSTGGDSTTATTQANGVIAAFKLNSVTITFNPTVTNQTPTGTTVVVTCSAPLAGNTATTWCLGGKILTATVTMTRL